jgi:outer membrane protein OmpA-like peptidoglycan-associated protein
VKNIASYNTASSSLRDGVRLHAARRHRFTVRPNQLARLELVDVLFATNSAVMMPFAFEEDEGELHGLDILYVAFRYAAEHPDARLLVAGHTDTAGAAGHNLRLSEARARSVHALLAGDREAWVEIVDEWHRVEDVQRLLKHYRDIDPGPIDDAMGDQTRRAIETFQAVYNHDRVSLGIPGAPEIQVDGRLGPETWGAFFDYYQFSLAQLLGCGPQWTVRAILGIEEPSPSTPPSQDASGGSEPLWRARLDQWRRHLRPAHPQRPAIGLGESFPVEEASRDHYRSEANRRVEILFFQADDVPSIPSEPANGSTYTPDECPFCDSTQYRQDAIDAEAVFEHVLELQTVNEEGAPVPRTDLLIRPLRGGETEVTSDDHGYVRTEEVPPGLVVVQLADGSPTAMRRGDGYSTTLLPTSRASDSSATIATVIVETTLSREDRVRRSQNQQMYQRSVPRPSGAPDAPDDAESADADVDPAPPPVPTRYAHDNLALIAGFAGESLDQLGLRSVLDEWLGDYFPQVTSRGYILFVLDDQQLRCINPEGDTVALLPLRESVQGSIQGAVGAYAAFATPGDPLFRDMQRFSGVVSAGDIETAELRLDDLLVDDPTAQSRLQDFFHAYPGRFQILYRAPTGAQLQSLAWHGGAGMLEDYGTAEGDRRSRIHDRNVAVAEFVAEAYLARLQRYIDDVNAIGPPDLEQFNKLFEMPDVTAEQQAEAARQARQQTRQRYADLKALGPPPRIYMFPRPVGATDDEWEDIFEANNESEFRAYKAVSEKIDEIEERHSEGAVYLRLQVKINGQARRGAPDEAHITDGHFGQATAKLEHTIDFGTDGLLVRRDVALAGEAQIGPNQTQHLPLDERRRRGRGETGLGVEGEWNVESGERKVTAKGSIRGAGIELASDGQVKLKAPNGAQATYNVATNEFGQGVEIDLESIVPEWVSERTPDAVGDTVSRYVPSQIYVGLHMQGILEESILAYLTMAPGFFERRQPYEFFDPTLLWNDLSGYEQENLKILGWTRDTWDRRGVTPYEEFPDPCYSDPSMAGSGPIKFNSLSDEERIAAVRLGLDRRDWGKWKDAAQPE